ncbi:O-antigen ligase family protein [Sphingomonas sp. KRR8]|uniref:O-antigen ligase family protein n=1 Tax=Sphingomonas sp. KRR8 TaxID=2942996 RepID=UPI0020215CC6|nr:O-antigen ligase family protein [Sphingomonas sp. KRR8]URD61541.1 O-antigen ligase family protein [Sphingomonas sp. KRR8]
MKWIALALLLVAIPAIAGWLRTRPTGAPIVWGLLTFLPFVITPWHLFAAPYSTPMWSGYVKGWEFTLLDAIALAILAGSPQRWRGLKLVGPFVLYLVAVLLAVFQARFTNLALSYAFQLLRVGLVLLAATQVMQNDRGERALITGLVLGLTVQAAYALVARAGGALQTGGSLGHQNLLGFASHMAIMPVFASLLAGRNTKIATLGVCSGLLAVALTASRATILISGTGMVTTLLISCFLRFNARKGAIALAGMIVLAGASWLAYESLQRRFQVHDIALLEEDSQRIAFARAAGDIIRAKPLGVGPNFYNFIANTEGYNARAGVNWSTGNRSAQVHNSYLLALAETGYPGLVALVILLGSGIWLGCFLTWRFRSQPESELALGLLIALLCVCVHSFVEWMLLIYPVQYLLGTTLGMLAGLSMRLNDTRRRAISVDSRVPTALRRVHA